MSSLTPNGHEHAVDVLKRISENKDFHDVQLVAELDGKKIPAHRLVMASSSDYFRAMLDRNSRKDEQVEVIISGVDGPTLQTIIEFCYSGHICIDEQNFHQILDAASPMGLVDVEQKCELFGIDNLRTSNCLDLFLAADKHSLNNLRESSLVLSCEQFEALHTSELCKMPLSFITDLLKSDQIEAREDFIFHRLSDWIAADEIVRSQHASDLLKLIDMDKLTLSVFVGDVTSFAKKFDGTDSLLNGHDCRAKSDVLSTNLYRCDTENPKQLFAISYNNKWDEILNVHKYNPITDRWTLHRNIPISGLNTLSSYGLMLANNKIFMIGGGRNREWSKTVDKYLLEEMRLFKFHGQLKTVKLDSSPILYKDRIYLFGGFDGTNYDACESLTLKTMTTEHVSSMEFGRYKHAAAVLNDKMYVVGGYGCRDADDCENGIQCVGDRFGTMRSAECYDPKSNKWTRIANMSRWRMDFAVVEWSGMLYAIGCRPTVERYDPIRNIWTEIGSFDGSDKVIRAVNWQNEIYVIMKDGQFGKVTVQPVCTFLPLHDFPSDYSGSHLFID